MTSAVKTVTLTFPSSSSSEVIEDFVSLVTIPHPMIVDVALEGLESNFITLSIRKPICSVEYLLSTYRDQLFPFNYSVCVYL